MPLRSVHQVVHGTVKEENSAIQAAHKEGRNIANHIRDGTCNDEDCRCLLFAEITDLGHGWTHDTARTDLAASIWQHVVEPSQFRCRNNAHTSRQDSSVCPVTQDLRNAARCGFVQELNLEKQLLGGKRVCSWKVKPSCEECKRRGNSSNSALTSDSSSTS